MNTEREPVPADDAIAAGLRSALEKTVAEAMPASIEWTAVLSHARRMVFLRRVLATSSLAVVLIVGVTAVALASTSGHRRSGDLVIATATTRESESTTTSTVAPSSTTVPQPTTTVPTSGPCTVCATTSTSTASPLPAQPGDFSGRLDHWGDSCDPCHPGDGKNLQLTIRNLTDHDINLSPSASVRVALICATDMTPDGRLTAPLPPGGIDTFVDEAVDASGNSVGTAATLAPGAQAATLQWGYATNDIGTLTCEGAIVSSSDGTWRNETLSVVSRLTNIATYSVEVTDSPSTTAPPPATAPPETTTPSVA